MKKLLIFQCLFVCIGALAQQSWSLDECISYALEHNLQLNDLNYNKESNRENYRQSFRELLPSLSGSSNYTIRYGRSVDPNTNEIVSTDFFSNSYSLNASIDLFQGFQKLNSIASAKFLYKAAQEETLHEKYLLAFRVMTAFYDVQFFEGLEEISKEQAEISQKNYELVKKQIEIGTKAGTDLYEAESVLIADKLNLTQSRNSLQAARLKLIQEMNLENTSSISINTSADIFEEEKNARVDKDSIYQKALSFIPIIKGQELRVKAAKKDIAVARGNLYPSLSMSAGYGTDFFETNVDESGEIIPFRTQLKDNASQSIGFTLRIPISQRWSSRSRVKQQKIALLRASNTLEIRKQELNQLLRELVQNYEASLNEYEQTKQSEASNLLAFRIAQKKYDKGLISAVELFQSKNLYAKAQNENLQLKLKVKVQRMTLDFYMGLPVFNIDKTE
ncbi:TolC family protein [Leptobacterium flavescens]|uniref:TolC family protein n=1 Tax=Leptobacterium flavescens TaxID=472055 RepID=A0A6P0URN0_9FLAO|nr:TolC family protein [Leptobacterium flavescens]NER13036.1 TolC family protein [Leptobacterium flavescens]